MKIINATQNDDNTWHVIIREERITRDTKNGVPVEERCFATTDIPRADIKIIAYQSMDEDESIFTLTA